MSNAVSSVPREDRFKPRGQVRWSRIGAWRAAALIAVHLAAIVHFAHWKVSGTTVTPLEPSEAMQTLELGYVNAGFIVIALSILLTLLLGRWFCGWVCHFVAYQDLCGWLLRRIGLKPKPVRSRLLVLVPFAAAFYMFVWPTIERLLVHRLPLPEFDLALTTRGFWDTFPGPVMAIATILTAGFLVVYWMGAKGFCSYGCPYGAFFGVADRLSPMRIKVTDACGTCGHCTTVCSSNVRVHEEVAMYRMVVDPGCMKTLDCVNSCPNDALYYGRALRPLTAKTRRWVHSGADFTWGEEIAMVIAGAFAFSAFRGTYSIPFLMAISLGVLFAIATLTTWRLLRHDSVRFQNHELRTEGRFTRAGRVALLIAGSFILFTSHTSVVHFAHWRAEVAWDRSITLEPRSPEHDAALAECVEWFERSLAWGLFDDAERVFKLARVEHHQRRYAAAEQHARRALAIRPGDRFVMVELADLLALQGELEAGEALLREVLADRPDFEPALTRLRALEERRRR